jgi:hypothetical protein
VGVIPSLGTGPVLPLTALGWLGRGLILVFAIEVIGAVSRRIPLALSTEELVLELAILAAELFDFGFEFPLALDGPRVHRLPVPELLAKIEVLAPQVDDFLAELANLATKLTHQIGQIRQLGGWKWVEKRAVHDKNVCTENLPCDHRAIEPRKRVERSFTTRIT